MLSRVFTIFTIVSLVCACTGGSVSTSQNSSGGKSLTLPTGPQGNGAGYQGGDLADQILFQTLNDVSEAVTMAAHSSDPGSLCSFESYCNQAKAFSPDSSLCWALKFLTTPQKNRCSQFIQDYAEQIRTMAQVPFQQRFEITETPLKASSFGGTAQVELSSQGKIQIYRPQVGQLSGGMLLGIILHEFGHLVDLGGGKHIEDGKPFDEFTQSSGGRYLLDAVGAAISLYYGKHLYRKTIKNASPFAYWPMDESNAQIRQTLSLRDESGNNRPLQLQIKREGFSQALAFFDIEGKANLTGLIALGNGSSVTMEFWANLAYPFSPLSVNYASYLRKFPIYFGVNGLFLPDNFGTLDVNYNILGDMHIVMQWKNGSPTERKLYVNGQQRTLSNLPVAPLKDSNKNTVFPSEELIFYVAVHDLTFSFNGVFNELSLYNRELPEEEISQHYRSRSRF